MLGMPIVGLLIGKVDSRKLVGAGLMPTAGTLLWLGQLNLHAGYWDFFWPQFLQGLGLSATFVPLTRISMDRIAREKMGNATSLFNLKRNLGGSVGIAVTATMLSRQQQAYVNVLGSNVDAYSAAPSRRHEADSRPAARTSRPRPSAPTRRCSGRCNSRRRWCRSCSCSGYPAWFSCCSFRWSC